MSTLVSEISIRGFQSLSSVDLTPGSFTVIVGASSSGKSALLRALRCLVVNPRSASFITEGADKCSVSVRTQANTVTFDRTGQNTAYRVDDVSFTKLAGTVPLEVSAVLSENNTVLASQFDRPFLLDETGSSVARTLGSLTGVNMILEGVREANRRRLVHGNELTTRTGDLAQVEERLAGFSDLEQQKETVGKLHDLTERAENLFGRINVLERLLSDLTTAETVLAREVPVQQIPDIESVTSVLGRLRGFTKILNDLRVSSRELKEHTESVGSAEQGLNGTEKDLHDLLTDLGVCPLCSQRIG